jgi:hypothetical protein
MAPLGKCGRAFGYIFFGWAKEAQPKKDNASPEPESANWRSNRSRKRKPTQQSLTLEN